MITVSIQFVNKTSRREEFKHMGDVKAFFEVIKVHGLVFEENGTHYLYPAHSIESVIAEENMPVLK